jgi:hypothetical protein
MIKMEQTGISMDLEAKDWDKLIQESKGIIKQAKMMLKVNENVLAFAEFKKNEIEQGMTEINKTTDDRIEYAG